MTGKTFFQAIFRNDIDTVTSMLQGGTDPNVVDSDSRSGLIHAAIDKQPRMMQIFVSHGADIQRQDRFGRAAIHYAVQGNCRSCVELLISQGAEVNIADVNGNTPLSDAVFYYKAAYDDGILELLLSHGAKPDIPNKFGMTPKILAKSIASFPAERFFGNGFNAGAVS
jgi:uncharacterized protein